jgi:hypothetical protein
MITFFATMLRFILRAFRSKRIILSENALLKKENDILLRREVKMRVRFNIEYLAYHLVSVRTGVEGPT